MTSACRKDGRPRRPALPVALYALVATVVSMRAMLADGLVPNHGGARDVVLLASLACVGVWAACMALGLGRPHVLLPVALCLVLSANMTALTLAKGERLTRALLGSPVSRCTLRIQTDPVAGSRGYRSRAVADCGEGVAGDVWLVSADKFDRGSTLRCVGRFEALADDEWGTTSRMQGVWGTVTASRVLEASAGTGTGALASHVRKGLLAAMDCDGSEERALLAGCVCGYRDGLERYGLQDLFARCGVSHLVAVSGAHLSILASMLSVGLMALRMGSKARAALVTAVCGLYVALCGLPISAVRAWLMTVAAMAGGLAGRRAHGLSGVSFVALAMALANPTVTGQLGYLLSVSAVCGLCVFSSYATYVVDTLCGPLLLPRFLPRGIAKRLRQASADIRQSMAASVVAQLVTLPIVADAFGELSLVGPLASVLVAMPFGWLVTTGMLSCCLTWVPWLHEAALWTCDRIAALTIGMLRALAAVPGCVVRTQDLGVSPGPIAIVVLVGVLLLWPRVSRRALVGAASLVGCVGLVLTLRWRFAAPARVVVMDVGQGDAILVQDGASALLVDLGPDDAVAAACARNHVTHLDAVLITHLHADHYAGIAYLPAGLSCDHVYVARGVSSHVDGELAQAVEGLCGHGVEEVGYGDVLQVGGFVLRVVWPLGKVEGDENADSLMLDLTYDTSSGTLAGLLTGDAERDELAKVLDAGDVGDIDVLKVGHHGSAVSISPDQAMLLDPEVSVASAGEANAYGHPTPLCVEALEQAGSRFLCTKDYGDVQVCPGPDGPVVRCRGALLVAPLHMSARCLGKDGP